MRVMPEKWMVMVTTWRLLVTRVGALSAVASLPRQYLKNEGTLQVLDAGAMVKAQEFALSPEALMEKTEAFISSEYGAKDETLLADDFEFVGPVVGPLDKAGYVSALTGALNPLDGFPDLDGRHFGFCVDPVEPGRVWWITRPTGTFTAPFFNAEPDGRVLETPPQCMGVLINSDGAVRKLNVGNVIDRTQGNTGGLGGLFGFLWFVGKPLPIPECRPYKKSFQFKLLSLAGNIAARFRKNKD